ncbi:PTS fructose transporter subunit IIA [Enterobacter sp. Cy-643]|uniref:fructose PTS transporter subunit IIA n=1 Tax=Enterobacter sp. Cy-643 TaxID=2608346 RepID=UPI0014243EB5|nr:fructose PTS transporter subunit IIA [Enterobacter sp. Cy-643]NIF31234.1 PTS fructose transporter subunit IIA [Enterobacter sp. Cy-643]
MQTVLFRCPLVNGLHARPASALERQASRFMSSVTLVNQTKSRRGDAKSVLALVGVDVAGGDECQLLIEGPDEQIARQALGHFIEHEFTQSDSPLAAAVEEAQPLPVFLSRSASPVWQGKGVSPGVALARAVFVEQIDLHAMALRHDEEPFPLQQQRLNVALQAARQRLREEISQQADEVAQILDAQRQLLEDETVEECLLDEHDARNTLAALAKAVDVLREPFRQSDSEYLRQRELDIFDLGLRIAAELTGDPRLGLPRLDKDALVIGDGVLTPGQLLMLRGPFLRGIVMPTGGETSHTVILARALATPLLCLASTRPLFAAGAGQYLLGAGHGFVLAAPDDVALRWYELECKKLAAEPKGEETDMFSPALVFLDEKLSDKHEVIKRLTDNLEVQRRAVSATLAEQAIWQREAVFTTALGFSIAIPHCKSAAISRSSISVLRLADPLDWGDGAAVRLVIMLTLSEQEQAQHMRIFSVLARRLMHESFREKLLAAATAQAVVDVFREEVIILS